MAFPPSKARYPGGPAAAAPVAPAPSAGADADGAAKRSSFKVLKALGKGSYGTVYKVQRIQDEQFYALKETDLGSMNQNERADSVNEVRLLVSIDHPNVVRSVRRGGACEEA